MKLVPFKPEHVLLLDIQVQQQNDDSVALDMNYGKCLDGSLVALTGVIDDRVIFCIGLMEIWANRYYVWALLSKEAAMHMLTITKSIKRIENIVPEHSRVEAIVRWDFEQGHRWVRMFKFTESKYEKRFLPNGSDAVVYVRYT